MSELDIAATISTRVKDLIEVPLSIPVQYDNASLVPPANSPWIRCKVVFTGGRQVTCAGPGGRTFRQLGLVAMTIRVPIETGDADGLTIARTCLLCFKGISADGITYSGLNGETPSIVDMTRSQDDKWWEITMVAPWFSDELL